MADIIKKSTNKFTKGLIMDFSPENTQNEVLTHALNATLLTFNGNELSLQNDMGNGRVETAFLPEGYMPVGTCEYGGIIYIVSYNPLEDKSQIGCFPSPERNISNDELGIEDAKIAKDIFQTYSYDETTKIPLEPTGGLKNTTQYVLLKSSNLNPGDKFLINSTPDIYNERLKELEAFEKATAELKEKAASGDEEYDDALTKMIKEAADELGSKDLIIQMNEKDTNKFKSQLDENVSTFQIDDVNFQLGEPIDTIGGAIVKTKSGDIEVNNTIESRLERFKSILRSEVANVLFK